METSVELPLRFLYIGIRTCESHSWLALSLLRLETVSRLPAPDTGSVKDAAHNANTPDAV